jgi:2,6-dihydroxypyridine 3-monooxygenase
VSASRPRVIVAGGSLGGLSAALWLRDAGCEVDVCERSRAPLEGQGAGIVLNPATIRWFVEHERDDADAIGVCAHFLRYLGRDGEVAAELAHSYRFTSYDTLYRRLLAAFGPERYHLGEEVVGGGVPDATVSTRLASGVTREGELLVWADGIRSLGRGLLVPGARARYAGYVAWRGTVTRDEVSEATLAALDDAISYCVLPNSHALTYPIPQGEGSTLNWLWYRNVERGGALDALMTDEAGRRREVSVPPGAVAERHVEDLRAAAAEQLPPPLVEVVHGTAEPFLQAVFDVEVPRMAFERQCLIGDAAFAARPHAAAGSAKAAEDGYRLGLAMRETGRDVPAALARWEPHQLDLGRRVLARTREAGDRSQFHGTWKVGDPLPFGLYEVGDSILAPA